MCKIKNIGFDFDGVIADTNREKLKWLENKNIKITNADKTTFFKELKNMLKDFEIENLYKEMSDNSFKSENVMNIQPINNVVKKITELSKKFNIYIITARYGRQIVYTRKWLKRYKIEKYITDIISSSEQGKDKLNICIDKNIICFCDDDLRHLENNVKYDGIKILFSDTKEEHQGILKIDNWQELREKLKILLQE